MRRIDRHPEEGIQRALRADKKVPVRKRITDAAKRLFSRFGPHAVSVRRIAEEAKTNTATVLKYFGGSEELILGYYGWYVKQEDPRGIWDALESEYPGDPAAQLDSWLTGVLGPLDLRDPFWHGCPISNLATELRSKGHPLRALIRNFKVQERNCLAAGCGRAGYGDPDYLAQKLFLIVEGARVAELAIGSGSSLATAKSMIAAELGVHGPPTNSGVPRRMPSD